MKWRGRGGGWTDRGSPREPAAALGGGGFPMPMGKVGGGGIGTILLVLLFLFISSRGGGGGLGVDPGTGQFAAGARRIVDAIWTRRPPTIRPSSSTSSPATSTRPGRRSSRRAARPTSSRSIVLYDNGVQSACGNTPSTVGPFYCPRDHKVYLDLTFMEQLQQQLERAGRLRAGVHRRARDRPSRPEPARRDGRRQPRAAGGSGERERALGAGRAAGRLPGRRLGALSLHTQATCSRAAISRKALNAAAAVGDDRIQKQSGRGVDPDSFTHGSSEQRVKWFKAGFDSRRPDRLRHVQGRRLDGRAASRRPARVLLDQSPTSSVAVVLWSRK